MKQATDRAQHLHVDRAGPVLYILVHALSKLVHCYIATFPLASTLLWTV